MALSPGFRLGAYEILGKIGEGGMGEVYRARDTRLKRDVAIKVLPAVFAADPDRLARFEREAELLATLNHPNIAAIYGFEEAAAVSVSAIVLELVEGPTLADRIAQGPIPLHDALAIARQVSDALAAAHDKGIVHRDLKPANIKVTAGGQVKVLDFGLAKAMESVATPASIALSMSPTMVSPATQAGLILGTAAYMSPEQARGKAVDERADIWSFGCVLFEMLTGRPPFDIGDTVSDAIAAILTRDPDWSRLPPGTPASVRRLLRRSIEREPDRRLHHIGDARLELDEPGDTDTRAAGGVVARPSWRTAAPWVVVALALGLATFIALRPSPVLITRGAPVTRLELNLPQDLELYAGIHTLALSPDGSRLAFIGTRSGTRQVYIRRLDQFEVVPVRGTDTVGTCFFSADGTSVGFVTANGVLRTVALADGVVTTLADRAGAQSGAAWASDGSIVFGRGDTLWRARTGGVAQPLIKLDAAQHESRAYLPNALPGGTKILFTVTVNDRPRIDAIDMATGDRHIVIESGSLPLYTSAGYLVFIRDGRVLAAPFDAAALRVTGPPVQLLDDVPNLATGASLIDLSVSGTFVYSPTTALSRLVWVSRHGDEQVLNDGRRNYTNPRISPDGQQILVQAGDLWMQDLLRGTFSRLTNGDSLYNAFPRWLSDTRVVYRSANGLRTQGTNGPNDAPQLLAGTTELDYPGPLAADGDTMIVGRSTETTSFDIVALSLRDPSKLLPILQSPAYESGQWLSPDRRWLSYVSNESGRNEIYLMPYPGPGPRLPVSTQGGTQAIWSRDGKEIFYRIEDKMMAVEVTTSPALKLSTPKLLFESRYAYGAGITIANFDVAADGRFVMVKPESGSERLNVVLNWFADRGAAATTH